MKKRIEILEQMEFDRKEPAGGDITPTAAVDAINVTAKKMEILYKSMTTAKSHLADRE